MSELKEAGSTEATQTVGRVMNIGELPLGAYYGDVVVLNSCRLDDGTDPLIEHFERATSRRMPVILGYVAPALVDAKETALPTAAPLGQEYVDPYLFEIGHFKSREEYEELSRTAKIKPRTRA